jgi:hypothetical protein
LCEAVCRPTKLDGQQLQECDMLKVPNSMVEHVFVRMGQIASSPRQHDTVLRKDG